MNLRLATFNANNLFRRATVLDLDGFSTEARAVLNDLLELNTLLALPTYDPPTKTRLEALLKKYGFHTRKENPWFDLLEARGSLYTVKQTGELTLTAPGRDAWHGWIELRNEIVTAASTANTARVIAAVKADVLCLVEIEDRTTLVRFNEDLLRKEKASYPHCLLVDGNDPRGIDVGIFSRLEIRSIRSHVDDTYTGLDKRKYPVFSRDCAEYELALPDNRTLWLLCNHFKSQGYGAQDDNDRKRKKQADRVREIVSRFNLAKDLVVVAGDFNDTADNPPIHPLKNLLATPNLRDVLNSPKFTGPRWTFQTATQQLDYLLCSKPLFASIQSVGIERRGIYHPTSYGGKFPHFPEVTSPATQASDHAAVWADFTL